MCRHWKDVSHIKLVHRWYVLYQTVQDVRKGGTQTPKHILKSHWTGGRPWCLPQGEPPAHSRRGPDTILSGLLAAATRLWFGWYGERSSTGPGRDGNQAGRQTKGADGSVVIGRGVERFWDRSGRLFLFPSSPMWKRHSARRKTGVDRTQRQKDWQASYPPPDLKEKWQRRLLKERKRNTNCCLHDRRWRCLRNERSHSALQW